VGYASSGAFSPVGESDYLKERPEKNGRPNLSNNNKRRKESAPGCLAAEKNTAQFLFT